MSDRLKKRFRSSGSDVLLETNVENVTNRMKGIIDEYYNADISVLRKLQQSEFLLNPTYKEGWDKATQELESKRNDSLLKAVHQLQFPDEYHIALICYSLESPAVYKEFNKQTRNVKQSTNLDDYYYKSFFIFLMKSVREMYGFPEIYPGCECVVYRGCKTIFGNVTPGQYIIFQQFTSTSFDESTALKFSQGGTLFEIRGCIENATGMGHHSVFPDESELVIWPFEYFQIKRAIQDDAGFTRIILEAYLDPCKHDK